MPVIDFQFNIEDRADFVLITLRGELYDPRAQQFSHALMDWAKKVQNILVDMGNLDYICSAGLGMLISANHLMKQHKGEIVIAGADPELRKLLEIAGFSGVFKIFDTIQDAVSYLQPE